MTVEDYFANRFESPRAIRGLSAIAGVVVSAIYLVGQYTAISIVLIRLFAIPRWEAAAAHCRYHYYVVHGYRWPVRSFLDDLGPRWGSHSRRLFYGTASATKSGGSYAYQRSAGGHRSKPCPAMVPLTGVCKLRLLHA